MINKKLFILVVVKLYVYICDMNKENRIAIRINGMLMDALETECEYQGESMSVIIREILEEALEPEYYLKKINRRRFKNK